MKRFSPDSERSEDILVLEGPTNWLGPFWVASRGGLITEIRFGPVPERAGRRTHDDPLLLSVAVQIQEFLASDRRTFRVPLDWSVLPPGHGAILRTLVESVPWGDVVTYGELAAMAGLPGAARAAGAACRHNPFALVAPAHRVIAAGGRLGGYAGRPDIKKRLLDREGSGPFTP